MLQTTLSYLQVVLAQRNLAIIAQSYKNAQYNRHMLEVKYEMGRIPKADNIKAQADVAMRLPQLKKAQGDFEMAMNALKVFTGLSSEKKITLTSGFTQKFPAYSREQVMEQFELQNHQVKMMKAQVHLSEQLAKVEKGSLMPQIKGFGQYQYYAQGGQADLGDAHFQNLGTLGLKMEVPLWNGGRNIARYQQSRLDAQNQRLQFDKNMKALKLELDNALVQYQYLQPTYAAHHETVYLNQKAFEAMQERFLAGQVSLTALNDAELQLTNSRMNQLLSLYEIHRIIATIQEFISGV